MLTALQTQLSVRKFLIRGVISALFQQQSYVDIVLATVRSGQFGEKKSIQFNSIQFNLCFFKVA